MSAIDRIDRFQRRHPWAGMPLAVIYKFFDDQGNYLTAVGYR
jgi:membrane protein